MGTTQARFPLAEDVAQNARAAATRDPRFLPLIPAELPEVCLEVTVLSTPQPLIIADYAQLLQRLRPGIDGVILSWGQRRGLLLPQVWRRIADPDTFLEMIARKAGIPPAQLRTCPAAVAVYTFEVTHFAEPGYREPGE